MCEVEETSRALSPSGSTHVLEGGGGGGGGVTEDRQRGIVH